jgi:hypothetical protein
MRRQHIVQQYPWWFNVLCVALFAIVMTAGLGAIDQIYGFGIVARLKGETAASNSVQRPGAVIWPTPRPQTWSTVAPDLAGMGSSGGEVYLVSPEGGDTVGHIGDTGEASTGAPIISGVVVRPVQPAASDAAPAAAPPAYNAQSQAIYDGMSQAQQAEFHAPPAPATAVPTIAPQVLPTAPASTGYCGGRSRCVANPTATPGVGR